MNLNELNIINEFYDYEVSKLLKDYEKNGQGSTRGTIGNLYETLAKKIILSIDPTLDVRKNDFLTIYSKSGKYKIDNVQVDWHVYKNNKLMFIVECKTYLDICYLKRTVEDFETIRKSKGDIPSIIFTGQKAIGKNAWGFYNEEYEFQTFVVNQTKQRNPNKPVYKTCDRLDVEELKKFAEYISKIIFNQQEKELRINL
jgi:hypothetical protein